MGRDLKSGAHVRYGVSDPQSVSAVASNQDWARSIAKHVVRNGTEESSTKTAATWCP